MKLYLSSYRLGRDPQRLRRLVGHEGRAGIVLNACDPFEEPRRVREREVEDMRSLGFDAEELDLRDYFGGRADLRARLATYALVWVAGGNAFVLARAMTASGFGSAALDLLHSGSLVYAGYSAGACVTGPDLEGVRLMDEPDAIPPGYSESMPPRTPRPGAVAHRPALAVRPSRSGERGAGREAPRGRRAPVPGPQRWRRDRDRR